MTWRFPPFAFVNWFLASPLLFRIKAWRAGLRPSATKKFKSLQKNLKTRTRRRKPCTTLKCSKNILTPVTRKDITPVELQEIIKKVVLAVRKKNGQEYEPSSLRAFIQSIDRHLRKNNYGFSMLNDKEFHEVQDILKKKQKQLKSIGKGNQPNAADPLSDEDIDPFYSRKVLGIHSPRALLNTLWINNCTFFGMRPGKEQRDLSWGDLQLKTDSPQQFHGSGRKCHLQFCGARSYA